MRGKIGLSALFILQCICAGFFLLDAAGDAVGFEPFDEAQAYDVFEYLIVAALAGSLLFTGLELRRLRRRHRAIEDQLRVASGAFAELLEQYFAQWALSPSERDVALLAIKGLSNAEMAALRETREGTIKAQCAAVYRKAGVSGRQQLLSLFIEELLAEALTPATKAA